LTDSAQLSHTPRIIPRGEHGISRKQISPNALKVLYRLHEAGFAAYLVGGCLRDLIAGLAPKDFDVATDASPEEVRKLFGNCRLIGRRFRLAHVHFGREIIEVATFRGGAETEVANDERQQVCEDSGRILRDNVFGTLEDDVWRRDFTINALYYNIADFSLVDYCGGYDDLIAGRVRLIGDPEQRYREDPVRLLRAVRFAVKLGIDIDAELAGPIKSFGPLLADIPPSRLFEEMLKLLHGGKAQESIAQLRRFHLLRELLPGLENWLNREEDPWPLQFLELALASTDRRVAADLPVTPAFIFAVLLWPPLKDAAEKLVVEEGMSPAMAQQEAAPEVARKYLERIVLPKRFRYPMQDIWALQQRMIRRGGRRSMQVLSHPRFRAAYDFLDLRVAAGDAEAELRDWWLEFQEANPEQLETLLKRARGTGERQPNARRGSRRRRRPGASPKSDD